MHACEFHIPLWYSTHGVEQVNVKANQSVFTCRTIHLLLGKAFLWQTELQRAHLHLTRALTHARKFNDLILELETQVALSHIYSNLNDHENALSCCNTTLQLVHSLSTKQTFSPEVAAAVVRFRRRLATVLSRPYCKLTRYNEALENCEVSMLKKRSNF